MRDRSGCHATVFQSMGSCVLAWKTMTGARRWKFSRLKRRWTWTQLERTGILISLSILYKQAEGNTYPLLYQSSSSSSVALLQSYREFEYRIIKNESSFLLSVVSQRLCSRFSISVRLSGSSLRLLPEWWLRSLPFLLWLWCWAASVLKSAGCPLLLHHSHLDFDYDDFNIYVYDLYYLYHINNHLEYLVCFIPSQESECCWLKFRLKFSTPGRRRRRGTQLNAGLFHNEDEEENIFTSIPKKLARYITTKCLLICFLKTKTKKLCQQDWRGKFISYAWAISSSSWISSRSLRRSAWLPQHWLSASPALLVGFRYFYIYDYHHVNLHSYFDRYLQLKHVIYTFLLVIRNKNYLTGIHFLPI